MTTASPPKNQLTLRGLIGLLGVFAGLCAIFALVVSVAEAWQEHAQAKWPEASARIQGCSVDSYEELRRDARRESYHVECRISYVISAEEVVTKIRSRSIPSPQRVIWQYPAGQFGRLQDWVDQHPSGSSIAVHYDPENHKKAVLTTTDMPYAGPRTPSNLRLLAIAAIASVVLLTIARMLRPRLAESSVRV